MYCEQTCDAFHSVKVSSKPQDIFKTSLTKTSYIKRLINIIFATSAQAGDIFAFKPPVHADNQLHREHIDHILVSKLQVLSGDNTRCRMLACLQNFSTRVQCCPPTGHTRSASSHVALISEDVHNKHFPTTFHVVCKI